VSTGDQDDLTTADNVSFEDFVGASTSRCANSTNGGLV